MTLDVKLQTAPPVDADARKQAVARVKAQKAAQQETMDDAWARVFATKLSDADRAKLQTVKQAMDAGKLGRLPDKAGKRFSKAEAMALYKALLALNREEILKRMVDDMPSNYHMVRNLRELRRMVELTMKEPIIAIDTETTGLDVYSDVIVGVSVTLPSVDKHFYVPSGHVERTELDTETVLREMKPVLDNKNIKKVLHNAKFDIHMFLRHGYLMEGLAWDTQEAMKLLNENEHSNALKNLAPKYLGVQAETYEDLFGKNAKFSEVPIDVATVYASKDTHLTWLLYEFQIKHFEKLPSIKAYCESVEVPLIYTVVEMERSGFVIDLDYAKTYGLEMSKKLESEAEFLAKEFGGGNENFNINSPIQLKAALENLVGKKLDSTDAKKVLKPLSFEFPIIERLLEYKKDLKLYSTYISRLPELVHKKTGKLHAQFKPNGAVTGRFSSGGNGVNLQNQPKSARKLFLAPEGYLIMGGDWSQQEVRALAHFTQEPTLLEAYRNGQDMYTTLASEVYGKPPEECGDGTFERKAMKFGVLSVMYGTGPLALAHQLGIQKHEAEAFIEDFFKRLPAVKAWIDGNQKFAKTHGYVWLDKQQRKRRLPDATGPTTGPWEKRGATFRAMRQATNAIIQGSSAIQTKVTLNALHKLCARKGWKLWATVHDEVLLLVPDTITDAEVDEFERVMLESYPFGDVPNKTDIELGRCWGEMKSRKEWFA